MMKKSQLNILMFLTILYLILSTPGVAATVKMSTSKICHDTSSPFYDRVTKFKAYESIQACILSGGRLPKGSKTLVAQNRPYDRDYFGHGWSDDDGDSCNTRAEILAESNTGTLRVTENCRVVSGRWNSFFTGVTHHSAASLDIDHLVALKSAWDWGASNWTREQRVAFANDPRNLVAVESSLNRQKSSKDPSEWLPPTNKCQFLTRTLRIIRLYQLEPSESKMATFNQLKTEHCWSENDR